MKQTAVEWLKMQLEIRSGIKEITVDSKTFEELCEQAKEMERIEKSTEYLRGFKDRKDYQIKLDELTFKSE